jgi:hypothetical protein
VALATARGGGAAASTSPVADPTSIRATPAPGEVGQWWKSSEPDGIAAVESSTPARSISASRPLTVKAFAIRIYDCVGSFSEGLDTWTYER